jgi:hypothetical protein
MLDSKASIANCICTLKSTLNVYVYTLCEYVVRSGLFRKNFPELRSRRCLEISSSVLTYETDVRGVCLHSKIYAHLNTELRHCPRSPQRVNYSKRVIDGLFLLSRAELECLAAVASTP